MTAKRDDEGRAEVTIGEIAKDGLYIDTRRLSTTDAPARPTLDYAGISLEF